MSPPPPPPMLLVVSIFLLPFMLPPLLGEAASSSSCSSSPACHPFHSPMTYPFSQTQGCGHPSFQIHCSGEESEGSHLFIKSHDFTVLSFLNNNTLLIRPTHLSGSSLPNSTIRLSNTPFRFANHTCSRLADLPRCANTTSYFGSSWETRVLLRPSILLHGCLPRRESWGVDCGVDGEEIVRRGILEFLNTGIELKWNPTSDPDFRNCSVCLRRRWRNDSNSASCGYNASDPSNPFVCYRPIPPSLSASSAVEANDGSRRNSKLVIFVVVGLFTVVSIIPLLALAVILFRCRNSSGSATPDYDSNDGRSPSSDSMVRAFLRRHQFHLRGSPVYSYDQLKAFTDGFSSTRKLGDGGFGSVYLAHMEDGNLAAVKRLHRHHPATTSNKSFCNEILILSSINHPNLVHLHGYCSDPRGLMLVYDYVPNGTLSDHLHGRSRTTTIIGSETSSTLLSWSIRVEMASQIASALEYLHFAVKPPIVHRDITSTNIFVEKDMRIKVGDFGLCRLLQGSDGGVGGSSSSSSSQCVWTGPQGTPGYLDPDYHHSFRLTEKSDVYSFGVVLLEFITGMKAVDVRRDKREVGLADMVVSKIQIGELSKVVDPMLVRRKHVRSIESMAELAFRCLAGDKDDRPDSRELVEQLGRIKEQTSLEI